MNAFRSTGLFLIALTALAALLLSPSAGFAQRAEGMERRPAKEASDDKPKPGDVLNFTMKDIDGKDVQLTDYKGKVILMVNVASKCGYTPQYKALEAIYEKYKKQGFVVLGFPSNDFGQQEPGNSEEIKKFCTEKYKVTFPMFEKVAVKDPESACDLYKFLTDKKKNTKYGGNIEWNFTKFLIDRKGEVRYRYKSAVKPDSKAVTARIESLLKVGGPPKSEERNDEPGDKDHSASPEKKGQGTPRKPDYVIGPGGRGPFVLTNTSTGEVTGIFITEGETLLFGTPDELDHWYNRTKPLNLFSKEPTVGVLYVYKGKRFIPLE